MSKVASLIKHTLTAGTWLLLRVIALALWVWLMAQQLAAEDFSWLASLLAVAAVIALFAPLGIPYLFFADAHSLAGTNRWREMLGGVAVAGSVLAVIGAVFLHYWLQGDFSLALMIGFMLIEVLCVAFVQATGLWGHAAGKIGIATGLPFAIAAGRTVAAGICMGVVGGTDAVLQVYLVCHLVVSVLVAAVTLYVVSCHWGLSISPVRPALATLSVAWRYAAMGGGSLASSELDKPLLTRVVGLESAGHYAIAYRLCAALAIPAGGLAASVLPSWVAALARGDVRKFKRSLWVTLIATLLLGLGMIVVLRVGLEVFPPGSFGLYPQAWSWMQGLAGLVVAIGLRQVAAAAMIAAQLPLTKALMDWVGFIVLAAALFLIYPTQGIAGVMLTTIAVELTTGAAMAGFVLLMSKKFNSSVV